MEVSPRPGSGAHHFCLHFIVQNSVAQPHLPAQEPGKFSQCQFSEENKNMCRTEPLPQGGKIKSRLSDAQSHLFFGKLSLNIIL